MAEWFDIKIRWMMGRDAGDDKEIRLLYRVVKWESDKLIYEADDKHVTNILFDRVGLRREHQGPGHADRQGLRRRGR